MISQVQGEIDSSWLGIDTLSTYCMTNDLNDFVGRSTPTNEKVSGVSSTKASITRKFTVLDDEGVQCELYIPVLY
jgi:hypothetical protein